jgi:hypothetical protein
LDVHGLQIDKRLVHHAALLIPIDAVVRAHIVHAVHGGNRSVEAGGTHVNGLGRQGHVGARLLDAVGAGVYVVIDDTHYDKEEENV